MMGMRRGRSAHTVEMPADNGVALEWRRGRSTARQGTVSSAEEGTDAYERSAAPSVNPSRSPSADPHAWVPSVSLLDLPGC